MFRFSRATLHSSYYWSVKCSKLFTVLNNTDNVFTHFRELGLSSDEAKVYEELLRGPGTPATISQSTGINRTRIYRVANMLEKKSLITKQTGDKRVVLVAADPSTLQVSIVSREARLKEQRMVFEELLPILQTVRSGEQPGFVVNTYMGVEGFKQMLWHELKAKGEVVCFGDGELEKLVPDRRWTEKQRALTLEAGYTLREVMNPGSKPEVFTEMVGFDAMYKVRLITEDILAIRQQIIIYNDTVSTYNWRHETKVGTEIISKEYADMMRNIFEMYWNIGKEKTYAG